MRCMRKTPHASGGKEGTCSWWTTSAPRTGGRASRDLARCSWRWPTRCTWPTVRRRSRRPAADDDRLQNSGVRNIRADDCYPIPPEVVLVFCLVSPGGHRVERRDDRVVCQACACYPVPDCSVSVFFMPTFGANTEDGTIKSERTSNRDRTSSQARWNS